MKISTLD